MKVNISALNEALDYINLHAGTENCKDFIIHVYTKDHVVKGREMKLNITSRLRKNPTKRDKVFHLSMERRYEENENIKAMQLYQHLTMPEDDWRRKLEACVTQSVNIAPACEYHKVNISCPCLTIEDIKTIILKIFKFIYSDDKFRELYVKVLKVLNWDQHKEISFYPSRIYFSETGSMNKPEFCLN